MKTLGKIVFALALVVVAFGGKSVMAQNAGNSVKAASQKMDAAVEGLNKALASGALESVSGAGDKLFNTAGDFGGAVAADRKAEKQEKLKGGTGPTKPIAFQGALLRSSEKPSKGIVLAAEHCVCLSWNKDKVCISWSAACN